MKKEIWILIIVSLFSFLSADLGKDCPQGYAMVCIENNFFACSCVHTNSGGGPFVLIQTCNFPLRPFCRGNEKYVRCHCIDS